MNPTTSSPSKRASASGAPEGRHHRGRSVDGTRPRHGSACATALAMGTDAAYVDERSRVRVAATRSANARVLAEADPACSAADLVLGGKQDIDDDSGADVPPPSPSTSAFRRPRSSPSSRSRTTGRASRRDAASRAADEMVAMNLPGGGDVRKDLNEPALRVASRHHEGQEKRRFARSPSPTPLKPEQVGAARVLSRIGAVPQPARASGGQR